MLVRFSFFEIESITDESETSILLGGTQAVPPVVVECATLAEVIEQRDTYAKIAAASGLCGRVHMLGRNPRGTRALNGFKKLAAQRGVLVNEHIGRAAGASPF